MSLFLLGFTKACEEGRRKAAPPTLKWSSAVGDPAKLLAKLPLFFPNCLKMGRYRKAFYSSVWASSPKEYGKGMINLGT